MAAVIARNCNNVYLITALLVCSTIVLQSANLATKLMAGILQCTFSSSRSSFYHDHFYCDLVASKV